jgi:hypothetical protein
MRIGSLVFATDQGLGVLAKDFYDNGLITDVLIVGHGRRPEHPEWYRPGTPRVGDVRSAAGRKALRDFCSSVDRVLFFETPFDWELFGHCRKEGVKTFLMPMYECEPKTLPDEPDLFICPSLLDWDCYPKRSVYLPVPVDPSHWKRRGKAETFVHSSGHGGLKGRNGTAELLEAIPLVKSPARFVIRSQDPLTTSLPMGCRDDRVEIHVGTLPRDQLYTDGEVFVFPEKFNGLSLPLQEARAAGMLVMATDRYPMNRWLPNEPLIHPSGSRRANVADRCRDFDMAVIDPRAVASKVDEWYGHDAGPFSDSGLQWALENSWSKLKPRYLEVLRG